MTDRLSTGILDLDEILGGGLIPGKTAVVYGATGVGKTVLGTTIAYAGIQGEGHPGIILDINQGVDEQGHIKYARGMLGWDLQDWGNVNAKTPPEELVNFSYFASARYTVASNSLRGIMHPSLGTALHEDFVRHQFPKTLRVIVDGSEPYKRAVDAQVLNDIRDFYEFLKGQNEVHIRRSSNRRAWTPLGTQPYWDYFVTQEQIDQYLQSQNGKFKFAFHYDAATDEERELWRRLSKDDTDLKQQGSFITDPKYLKPKGHLPITTRVEQYDTGQHIVVFLQTTKTKDIFELASAEIEVGGLDHEVNTVIAMGYIMPTKEDRKGGRGLAVLKHRGSGYAEGVHEYKVTDSGIIIHE